jgi:hypothetical protein
MVLLQLAAAMSTVLPNRRQHALAVELSSSGPGDVVNFFVRFALGV